MLVVGAVGGELNNHAGPLSCAAVLPDNNCTAGVAAEAVVPQETGVAGPGAVGPGAAVKGPDPTGKAGATATVGWLATMELTWTGGFGAVAAVPGAVAAVPGAVAAVPGADAAVPGAVAAVPGPVAAVPKSAAAASELAGS